MKNQILVTYLKVVLEVFELGLEPRLPGLGPVGLGAVVGGLDGLGLEQPELALEVEVGDERLEVGGAGDVDVGELAEGLELEASVLDDVAEVLPRLGVGDPVGEGARI